MLSSVGNFVGFDGFIYREERGREYPRPKVRCLVGLKQLTFVLIAVLVMGGFVAGQTVPIQKSVTYGPSTTILANELRYDAGQHTTYARGSVRIVAESSTMTADEADLHLLRSTREAVDLDIVLRGNVRVLVTPLAGGVR